MATAEDIAAFRLLIDEKDDRLPYSDSLLGTRLDEATSREALAGQIWREKAATYASLVNVSDSGSSRNMSDLHKNALAMAKAFGSGSGEDGTSGATRGVVVRRLTRR